jgi:anti-sigma regulatory factor (Ser/Thr protein kinase)
LRRGPDAPGHARRLVVILGLAPATHSIVELLVSELVTNAVVHSGAPEEAELSIALTREGEFIAAEVFDRGAGFAWQPGVEDLTEPGGLGLVLVDRLAHRWGIRREAGGAVWFVYLDPAAA